MNELIDADHAPLPHADGPTTTTRADLSATRWVKIGRHEFDAHRFFFHVVKKGDPPCVIVHLVGPLQDVMTQLMFKGDDARAFLAWLAANAGNLPQYRDAGPAEDEPGPEVVEAGPDLPRFILTTSPLGDETNAIPPDVASDWAGIEALFAAIDRGFPETDTAEDVVVWEGTPTARDPAGRTIMDFRVAAISRERPGRAREVIRLDAGGA